MVKKYWLAFAAVYLLMVHIVGGAIMDDYAYAVGNVLVAAIIGGIVTYRAKSSGGVVLGHATHFVVGMFLIFTAYGDATEDVYESMFNGCRYDNQQLNAAIITEESKDKYCTCMADLMVDDLVSQLTTAAFFFQEIEPIESNLSLQKDVNAAAITCSQGIS